MGGWGRGGKGRREKHIPGKSVHAWEAGHGPATLSTCQLAGDPRKEACEKKDLTNGAFLCLVMVCPSQCTPCRSF